MKTQRYELTTASPLLLHGAGGTRNAEVRTPPVRGLLRYWLRAALRGAGCDTDEVRALEGRLFGSAGEAGSQASSLRCCLFVPRPTKAGDYRILPHASGRKAETKFAGFSAGIPFILDTAARPGVSENDWRVLRALIPLAFALGGVGLRSRRGFGTMALGQPAAVSTLVDRLEHELPKRQQVPSTTGAGVVPVLRTGRCVVFEAPIGGASSREKVFEETLRRMMASFHDAACSGAAGSTFGNVAGGGVRFASAIHVRIFSARDLKLIRATIFRVEQDSKVTGLLREWANSLGLKPVWGDPWF